MSEFEDKLNDILSSPETMAQIAALANSLSGSSGERAEGEDTGPAEQHRDSSPTDRSGSAQDPESSGLGALLSGLDPSLLTRLVPLFQEYQKGGGERQALLTALKPFLKEESQEKIDKAIRITRLSHVIRSSMTLFREGGHV